ncbi:MAG: SDR family NAD(P)-dependent oxidoreductase [Streptosporangiales bacterium]|nr:SDR family NAD(P)-dependent oxidoreductase [Streptosporangiales bacterium]
MAKSLVVVGAGPGLGLGIARTFGRRGFRVGLVARSQDKLDHMVGELGGQGVAVTSATADLRDSDGLVAGLDAIRQELGPIDVVEYSPSPSGDITSAVETTPSSAADQFDLHVKGAITTVRAVLPEMRARGDGAILLTTGVSSLVAAPFLGNVGLAMAGLRNWALGLHAELGGTGVFVGTVTIASGVVPGDAEADPDAIGARYYQMYERRERPEEVVGDVDAFRRIVAGRRA